MRIGITGGAATVDKMVEQAAQAHQVLEDSHHVGKVLLQVR